MISSKARKSSVSSDSSSGNSDNDDTSRRQNTSLSSKKGFKGFLYSAPKLFIPNSKIRVTWSSFIFTAIWYNSLVTPIRLGVMPFDRTPQGIVDLDFFFDFVFLIDTILHFIIPVTDKNTSEVITDLPSIRQKYLGSITFYINTIACIPILKSVVSPFLTIKNQRVLSTNFNVLRMIRVLHFPSQFKELKHFLSRNGPVNESVFRMGIILFFALLLMCILGCVYFGFSTGVIENICPAAEDFEQQILSAPTWVANDFVITDVMDPDICYNGILFNQTYVSDEVKPPVCNDCPQGLFFTRSVYFLMQTLFTIGYGDDVAPSKSVRDMAMACFFIIFGVFGYGLIIANMTSVLSNVDVVNMRFRHDMDTIYKWLDFRSVPVPLRERVRMFFTYLNKHQSGMLDEHLFSDLSPKLLKDFGDHHIDLLLKVPFFDPKLRDEKFLSKVANVLVRRFYPPGSYILYQFEKQRELVMIKQGKAEICFSGSNHGIRTLGPGNFVGDYQLLFGTVNQVGLRSADFTEVLVLTYENFEKVMDGPDEQYFNFRSMGGNFRRSNDAGALDTLRESYKEMEHISQAAENINSQMGKFKSMMKLADSIAKGYRIEPDSKIHVAWDVFSILATIYYCINDPLQVATYYRANSLSQSFHWTRVIDYIIDAAFLLDMFLRMYVYAGISYETGRKKIIYDRELMRKNYLKSPSFMLDLVAVIPYDIISIFTGYHAIARLPKVIRAFQIPMRITSLQTHLEDSMDIMLNETWVSGLKMFSSTVLIVVWISAGWSMLRPSDYAYESVYWTLTTITTVGYGDLTPVNFRQTVFALIVGAAGATINASIIANVTSFFHDVELSEDNIDHKSNCIKYFMERHNISWEHTKKVQDYFDFIEREQDGLNEEELLKKKIPDHLRSNILIHITQTMILNCTMFAKCESGFLRKLMLSMEQRFFGADFMIMTSSTPIDGMFFVKKGMVELLTEKSDGSLKVFKKVEADECFAEDALVEHWKENPFLARAGLDSELWFLSRSKFNIVIDDFPQSRAMLQKFTSARGDPTRRATVHDLQRAAAKLRQRGRRFIHPDNYFIQFWFGIVLVVILYSIIVLPFRIAFMENHDINFKWVILDYFTDFLFVIDIILRGIFLGFYDDNHLITMPSKIWSHYMNSGKFKWHLFSVFPFEVIKVFYPNMCPFWSLQFWSILRLNKVFRVVEISYIFNRVESSLAKAGVKVPKNPLRVGKLLMVILLTAHWVACIFFIIANLNHHGVSGDNHNNWAYTEGIIGENPSCPGIPSEAHTMIKQYVASLYFAVATLTTVGYGDITANENSAPEVMFATLLLVVGTAIYTLVIALLEDIVSQLDVTSSLYKMNLNNVEIYLRLQGLPDSIKSKTTAYYDNLWRSQLGVKGTKLLSYMPRSLRCDMKLEILSPLIEKSFYIRSCSADFIASVVDDLSLEVYLPDDTIFHEGEQCDSLFFIYSGEIALFTSKQVKFKTVSNCILGESFFFSFEPHICTAKAVDTCEIYQLSIEDFLQKLHENHLINNYMDYLEDNQDELLRSKASIENMILNLRSSKMAKMMVSEIDTSIPKGVILPDSNFRHMWDFIALMAVIIYAITIPQQISFSSPSKSVTTGKFIFDLFVDLYFISDVYLRANHFAIMKDGFVVSSPKEFRNIYYNKEFRGDLLSICAVSIVGWMIGLSGRTYGFLRLIQLLRLRRFGKYFYRSIDTLNYVFKVVIPTGLLRIMQMFILVVILCHWFGCIYHFIGDVADKSTGEGWLVADSIENSPTGLRYLRSFYWALYTVTTIGFGSVPVKSISERIFAMIAMAIGAVICDAGITAILTSIISKKDHQAGTNSRRIQCCKKFMLSNCIQKDLQDRVLDYYNYIDTEVENINEAEILNNLSRSLKSEILRNFCFESLRRSYALKNFSAGALTSLMNSMSPYIAIPDEKLSEIGEKCGYLFVLQRGKLVFVDEKGLKQFAPIGATIGHLETSVIQESEGLPNKKLTIEFIPGNGLKGKSNPYVEITYGSQTIRSDVIRGRTRNQKLVLKINDEDLYEKNKAQLVVKGWHKHSVHTVIGHAEVEFGTLEERSGSDSLSERTGVKKLELLDAHNKKTNSSLCIRVNYGDLSDSEQVSCLEKTAVAKSYCHLYRMEEIQIEKMRQYLHRSKLTRIRDRMPISSDMMENKDIVSSTERQEKSDRRRPSHPSYNSRKDSVTDTTNSNDSSKKPKRRKMFPGTSVSIFPGKETEGSKDDKNEKVSTSTTPGGRKSAGIKFKDVEILELGDASNEYRRSSNISQITDCSERDWDNLVLFSDPSKRVSQTTTSRMSFFVEWENSNNSTESNKALGGRK